MYDEGVFGSGLAGMTTGGCGGNGLCEGASALGLGGGTGGTGMPGGSGKPDGSVGCVSAFPLTAGVFALGLLLSHGSGTTFGTLGGGLLGGRGCKALPSALELITRCRVVLGRLVISSPKALVHLIARDHPVTRLVCSRVVKLTS